MTCHMCLTQTLPKHFSTTPPYTLKPASRPQQLRLRRTCISKSFQQPCALSGMRAEIVLWKLRETRKDSYLIRDHLWKRSQKYTVRGTAAELGSKTKDAENLVLTESKSLKVRHAAADPGFIWTGLRIDLQKNMNSWADRHSTQKKKKTNEVELKNKEIKSCRIVFFVRPISKKNICVYGILQYK